MISPHNLPAEVSSFIGREQQVAELRRLLHRSRLITLTGPGGAGKTRLALRLAHDVMDHYPDGVWLVELAAVTDPRLLEQTVATSCGIREQRNRALVEVLAKTLGSRRMMVILDSCEHLVDSCASLVEHLLRVCPRLTVLITSREPLGLQGEVIWRTPSLSVPGPDTIRPELLLQSEAVRLFIERVRLSRPALELDGSVSSSVAQICARLEGIPLAIELAAGLARVLTFEDILVRLHDRFRLLTGGSRTALPRHQTLRAAVDWSYGLLSNQERELLARLSVFTGGFDLAAAEGVASFDPVEEGAVLQLLSRLVDKSLVVAERSPSQRTRYRMLDTIREYAHEKLEFAVEAEVRRRHARHYIAWCSQAGNEIRYRHQMEWLSQLDEEQGNVRLGLEWCLTEAPVDAMRLVFSMYRYWALRGHLAEGLDWCERALTNQVDDISALASAHIARANMLWHLGEYARARRDAERCEELISEAGPSQLMYGAVVVQGILAAGRSEWQDSMRLHEKAFQVAWQLKDPWWLGSSLNNLALIAMERGDHEVARGRLEQALASFRQTGDRLSMSMTQDSLARANLRLADYAASRQNWMEAIPVSAEFGVVNLTNMLEGLGHLEIAEGHDERAITLIAAAQSLRKPIGLEIAPEWKIEVDQTLETSRARVSKQAADAAWKLGAGFSLADAVRFATGEAPAAARHDASDGNGDLTLTPREKQVAVLIAEGLTNPEIAVRLRMAERTADAHVEHIRNKLGLRSRSQIAVWAHDRLGIS